MKTPFSDRGKRRQAREGKELGTEGNGKVRKGGGGGKQKRTQHLSASAYPWAPYNVGWSDRRPLSSRTEKRTKFARPASPAKLAHTQTQPRTDDSATARKKAQGSAERFALGTGAFRLRVFRRANPTPRSSNLRGLALFCQHRQFNRGAANFVQRARQILRR